MRNKFFNNQCYHIFNRGVEKRNIFSCKNDYERFLLTIKHVNKPNNLGYALTKRIEASCTPPRCDESHLGGVQDSTFVNIIAYCLNSNHFHLILEQNKENGISLFMSRLSNSYTRYFNTKHDRSGSLFQGKFKSVQIDTNGQLLYLSAYVNCNNFIHKYNKFKEKWLYSSYLDYIGKREGKLCNKKIILSQFKNNFEDYKKFCENISNYSKEKKEFVKYYLE